MITTNWDKERGIIFRHLEGDVSFDDLVSATKDGPKHPDFDDYPSTIWVFGKVNFSGKPENMSRQMPFVRQLTQDTGDGRKIAWVTRSEFAKSMLNSFFNGDRWSSTWQIFDTEDEAIAWCDNSNA